VSGGDDLLARAKAHSESAGAADPSWGEAIELEEDGGTFVGRFRGQAEDARGKPIYLYWDEDAEPRFMWHRYRLEQEMLRVKPAVGDRVALYRGPDYPTKDGNFGHAIGVETEPCADPLPADVADDDDGFPF
jgi:hypothetical protein